ncbi:hypothetical protein ACQ4PT_027958 [Festuca glaucescens]
MSSLPPERRSPPLERRSPPAPCLVPDLLPPCLIKLRWLPASTAERSLKSLLRPLPPHRRFLNLAVDQHSKCLNCSWLEASHVLEHLVCEGFVNGYRRWQYHGEASSSLESGRDAHVQQFDEVEENDDLEEDYDELAGLMRDMRHDFGDLSDVEDEGDHSEPADETDPFQQLVGKRMAREEGLSEEAHTYDDVREEQVARNAEKMKSLGLAVISSDLNALKKAAGKPKKKRALEVAIPESTRVLRSQSVMHGNQGRTIAWLYKHVGLFCFIRIPNNQILSQVSKEALLHMQLEVDKSKTKQASPPQEEWTPKR